MSVFSQKLQALIQPRIDKGQLTIYGLARNSKIDRSSLYKFINGERLPASTEILSRLVDALRLSPTQAFELRAAYDISRMGEERYRRRRHTLEFLNFFNQYVGTQPAETLPPPEPPPLPSGCSEVRTGVLPVNNLVQAVVGAETARPNGEILVIAQPDYDFLIHTLSALTLGRECSVQHILCLESESQEEDNHYNLGCLRAVVELMFSLKSYQPYCYYDNITSHFKNSNSLPYLIVTSECALQLSYNQKYAVCLRGAEYVAFFRKLFNDARKNANLMLSTLDTVTDNIRFYQNIFQKCAAPHWVCSCSPHILQSMDRELFEKYIYDIPGREEIIQAFLGYCDRQRAFLQEKHAYIGFFTREGIDYFCRTGRFRQTPSSIYAPLEPRDRWELLRRFCEEQPPAFKSILLRNNPTPFPAHLEVIAFWDGSIAFSYEHTPHQFRVMLLFEKSLTSCFEDFFTYLENSRHVFSVSETKAFLRQKMEELERLF